MNNKKKWITHEELKANLMKIPEFRREYQKLEPEFQIARQMISARLSRKMTQEELARRMGTGQAVVSRLEGMNARPTISLLERLSRALKTPISITITP